MAWIWGPPSTGIAGFFLLVATGSAAADDGLGKKIFMEGAGDLPACSICHTLAAAGASGSVGPDLDQLHPDAEKIRIAVREGVGVMPPFGEVLSQEEIEAVVEYVATALGD